MNRIHLAVLMFLLPAVASAQLQPDPGLWGGGFTNPNGEHGVPAVIYDPAMGLMTLNTVGLNRVRDTTTYTLVDGDDVGMVAVSIPSPEPLEFLLAGFVPSPNIGGGAVWTPQYFNGKAQIFVISGVSFLEPADRFPIIQYEPGLDCSEFGAVEFAANFGAGVPGDTIFGSAQCVPVPEPYFAWLILVAPATIFIFSRRYCNH